MLATWKRKSSFSFEKCNETHDSWPESTEMSDWWVSHYSSRQIANDHTNHRSFLKFRGKGQIPRVSSKLRGLRKTVGPINDRGRSISYEKWQNLGILSLLDDSDGDEEDDNQQHQPHYHSTQLQQQVATAHLSSRSCTPHGNERHRPHLLLVIVD